MKPNLAFFRIFWYAVNLLLVCSFAMFLYGVSQHFGENKLQNELA
jgi:hypothetical protein